MSSDPELEQIIRDMTAASEEVGVKPNYMIMAFDGNSFVHACFYESQPTKRTLEALRDELRTDEEFGLCDKADRLEFVVLDQSRKRI